MLSGVLPQGGATPVSSAVVAEKSGRKDAMSRQSLVPLVGGSLGHVGAAEARRVSWHEGVEDTLPSAVRRRLLQQAASEDEVECEGAHGDVGRKRRFWAAQPSQQQTVVYRQSRREGGGTKRTGRHKQRRWVSHQLLVAALRRCMYESGEDLTDTDGGGCGVPEPAKPSCWQLLQMNAVVCEAFRKRKEDALFRGSGTGQGPESRDARAARRAEQERRRHQQALRQNRTQQQQLLCLMQQQQQHASGKRSGGTDARMGSGRLDEAPHPRRYGGHAVSPESADEDTTACSSAGLKNGEAGGGDLYCHTVPICTVASLEEQRALLFHMRNQEEYLLQKLQQDEARLEKINPCYGGGQLRPSAQLLRAIRSSFRGVRALVAESLHLQTFLKAVEMRIIGSWESLRWIEGAGNTGGFVDNSCATRSGSYGSRRRAESHTLHSRGEALGAAADVEHEVRPGSLPEGEWRGKVEEKENGNEEPSRQKRVLRLRSESEIVVVGDAAVATTSRASLFDEEGPCRGAFGGTAEDSATEKDPKIQAELVCGSPVILVRAHHASSEGGSHGGVREALDCLRLAHVNELSPRERSVLESFLERRQDRSFPVPDGGNTETAQEGSGSKEGRTRTVGDGQSDDPGIPREGVLVIFGLDGLRRKLTHGLIALLDDLHAFSIPVFQTSKDGRGALSSNGRAVASECGKDAREDAYTNGVSVEKITKRGDDSAGKKRRGPRRQGTDEKALFITRRAGVQRGSCLSGRPVFSPADELLKAMGIVGRPHWDPQC